MDKIKVNRVYSNNFENRKYKLVKDANNLKKIKFKDVNSKYFMYLAEKYCMSNGISLEKKNFNISDFKNWLHRYIQITKSYADFLSAYDINLDSPNLAEIGKGKFDSIIGKEAYEISEFSEMMDRPKLIFGDLSKGLLIKNSDRILSLDDININTLITQNPNSLCEVDDFSILSKMPNREIAFGVYGNFDEKDTEFKTDMIKRLLETTQYNDFQYDTEKDNFYMLVRTTKPKVKVNVLKR